MSKAVTVQGITSYIPDNLEHLAKYGKLYDWDLGWEIADGLKKIGQPSFVAPGDTKVKVFTSWKSSFSVVEKYVKKEK